MTNSNQRVLTQQAVQEAAETLMLLHDKTTTLDVKNYLRRQNYLAFQRDVSLFMNNLVQRQATWKANDNGRYRVYVFGQDTQNSYHEYLEKGKDFWEIEVNKPVKTITLGKIGTDGSAYNTTLKSNRYAIHQAKLLVQQKLDSGYQKAIDQRLPKLLRLRYEKWLNQKVEKCTLAFYGVEKIEKQSANLLLNQQPISGYVLNSKSAGYEITFNHQQMQTIDLDKASWDATQIKDKSLYLTGEKNLNQTAFTEHDQTITDYNIQQLIGSPQITQLLIHQRNLYQVRLQFPQQKILTLSKFELDLITELLPLVKAFFK